MRTTLHLDDDVKYYLDYEADRTGKSLGKITSEIIRDSQQYKLYVSYSRQFTNNS